MTTCFLPSGNFNQQFFALKYQSHPSSGSYLHELKVNHMDINKIPKFDSSSSLTESTRSDDIKEEGVSSISQLDIQDSADRKVPTFHFKKKTELCKTYQLGLECPYGKKCSFAHGNEELRAKRLVPTNYKTTKCKQYFENDCCRFGPRCQFLHQVPTAAAVFPTLPTLSYAQAFEGLMHSQQKDSVSGNSKLIRGCCQATRIRRLPVFEIYGERR